MSCAHWGKALAALLLTESASGAAERDGATRQPADIGVASTLMFFATKGDGYATIACERVTRGGDDLACSLTMTSVVRPNEAETVRVAKAVASASAGTVLTMLHNLCSRVGPKVLANSGVKCGVASPEKARDSLLAYARRVLSRSCHLSHFSQTLRFKRTDATTWTSTAYGSCATAITTISTDSLASWELRMMHAPKNQTDEFCKSLAASMSEVSVWSTNAGPIAAGCDYIDAKL